jgi:hypothetical protein
MGQLQPVIILQNSFPSRPGARAWTGSGVPEWFSSFEVKKPAVTCPFLVLAFP